MPTEEEKPVTGEPSFSADDFENSAINRTARRAWWRIFRQGVWSGIVIALIVLMLFEYHRR